MRWMMRIMRLTLLARSEMISMFDAGYATRWPYCGISGRSTGTSCAALTLRTAMTCVMNSSEFDVDAVAAGLPGPAAGARSRPE